MFWGERFSSDKNQKPTEYKKIYMGLKESGVVLPTNYEYLDP
jgi:hypothetical protein